MRQFHLFRKRNKNAKPKPKCVECHKKFETEEQLVEHLHSVHQQKLFECGQCNSSFRTQNLLNEHLEKNHDFPCKRCLLKCFSQDNLDEHVKIHENNPAKFICRHCGKGLCESRGLMRHLRVRISENCSNDILILRYFRLIQVKNHISVNFVAKLLMNVRI